jgi:S-adenosylmethionine synthetase
MTRCKIIVQPDPAISPQEHCERLALRILSSALILLSGAGQIEAHSPAASADVGATPNKIVVASYVERAWLEGSAFSVKAKLDTGTKSSSLHAATSVEF